MTDTKSILSFYNESLRSRYEKISINPKINRYKTILYFDIKEPTLPIFKLSGWGHEVHVSDKNSNENINNVAKRYFEDSVMEENGDSNISESIFKDIYDVYGKIINENIKLLLKDEKNGGYDFKCLLQHDKRLTCTKVAYNWGSPHKEDAFLLLIRATLVIYSPVTELPDKEKDFFLAAATFPEIEKTEDAHFYEYFNKAILFRMQKMKRY